MEIVNEDIVSYARSTAHSGHGKRTNICSFTILDICSLLMLHRLCVIRTTTSLLRLCVCARLCRPLMKTRRIDGNDGDDDERFPYKLCTRTAYSLSLHLYAALIQ